MQKEALERGLFVISADNLANVIGYRRPRSANDMAASDFRPTLPTGPAAEPWQGWLTALEVQNRKLQETLLKFGIHPYDAAIGSVYNPALHERVGSKRVEGMGPLLIAEQRKRGFASQQPDFVLQRPEVIVTE